MTSALYLEHYLDGLDTLPNELKRNFTLMRELDTRAQSLMKQIDEQSTDVLNTTVSGTLQEDDKKDKLKTIQELFSKAKEYGDDKVQLAIQTYEMVDKHIRRLDSDLARFELEIQDKTLNARGKSEEHVAKKGRKKKDAKDSGKKKRSLSDDEKPGEKSITTTTQSKVSKKQKKTSEPEEVQPEAHATNHPSDVLDMPVDPNEPTYCLCHQVSYGEMIGCDNSECPIEWFHFACVGLSGTKPKGKWFCPRCRTEMDRKKK